MSDSGKPSAELQQLVADADTGGRAASGLSGAVISTVAIGWSLWQLWYASPLPFAFGVGLLNDTEARALHLGLALLLAFLAYPCLLYTSPSPRDRTRSRMPSSA